MNDKTYCIGVDYGAKGGNLGAVTILCRDCGNVVEHAILKSPCWSLIIPQNCPHCGINIEAKPVKHERTLVGDYRCPNCDVAFIDGMGTTPYCGNCGQKLEWPEVEHD